MRLRHQPAFCQTTPPPAAEVRVCRDSLPGWCGLPAAPMASCSQMVAKAVEVHRGLRWFLFGSKMRSTTRRRSWIAPRATATRGRASGGS